MDVAQMGSRWVRTESDWACRNEEDGLHSAKRTCYRLSHSARRKLDMAAAYAAWTNNKLVVCFVRCLGHGFRHSDSGLLKLCAQILSGELEDLGQARVASDQHFLIEDDWNLAVIAKSPVGPAGLVHVLPGAPDNFGVGWNVTLFMKSYIPRGYGDVGITRGSNTATIIGQDAVRKKIQLEPLCGHDRNGNVRLEVSWMALGKPDGSPVHNRVNSRVGLPVVKTGRFME